MLAGGGTAENGIRAFAGTTTIGVLVFSIPVIKWE